MCICTNVSGGRLFSSATALLSHAMSGEAGFDLEDAPTADAADFLVGTPDVQGSLRAGRGSVGNVAECRAVIVVPHDQGK
jgi:hypothetical protein